MKTKEVKCPICKQTLELVPNPDGRKNTYLAYCTCRGESVPVVEIRREKLEVKEEEVERPNYKFHKEENK